MTTYITDKNELKEIDMLNMFSPQDGEITQRYGRIGSGKTYGATADILDELKRGHIVYTNFKINYEGFDQRKSFIYLLGTILFPWKNKLFYFPKENLKYLPIDDKFMDVFEKLTGCSVYIDEGHVLFDSYEMAKMSMQKRVSVLHTRHFDRSINIISQRPTAVHVMLRANVNRFYKYEKLLNKPLNFPIILFRRTEFQDMTNETVDETIPLSFKLYLGNKQIFNAYNTKYLRGDLEESQKLHLKGYKYNFFKRLLMLSKLVFGLESLSPSPKTTPLNLKTTKKSRDYWACLIAHKSKKH